MYIHAPPITPAVVSYKVKDSKRGNYGIISLVS